MKLHDVEVERFKALLEYNILDTGQDDAFDELARLTAYICKTPIALISFIDENREWFKSMTGIDSKIKEVPRDKSFGAYVINHPDEVLAVTRPLEDDRTKQNPLLKSYPDINFIAGLPLVDRNGHKIGSLCVLGFQEKELSFEQVSFLQTIARKVILQLERGRSASDAEPVPQLKFSGEKGDPENDGSENIHRIAVGGAGVDEKMIPGIEINDEDEDSSNIRNDIKELIVKLERQNRKLILLCEMDELLQASHDEEEVYRIITNYSNKLFPGESGFYISTTKRLTFSNVFQSGEIKPTASTNFSQTDAGRSGSAGCIM